MTDKLIEPKRTALKPLGKVDITPATKIVIAEMAPPKFTPCEQCGYPDDCAKANWCVKGFK